MKKFSVAILVLALCATMFGGCAPKDENKENNTENNEATETPAENPDEKPDENPQENPTGDVAQYEDGSYEVMQDETSAEASHGWAEFIKAEVENGKVASITYDAMDSEGNLKSQTTKDNYPMTPHPTEWIPQFNDQLKKAKSPEDIEAISGATNSSNIIKVLYGKLLENMQAGKTGSEKISTESSAK